MRSIEANPKQNETESLRKHLFSRVATRIAGVMIAATGLSVGIEAGAQSATARTTHNTARPVTSPNLVPNSAHRETTRDRSFTFADYNEAASAGPILRKGALVLVNCVATDQGGNKWYLINHPDKGFAGYWDETTNFNNGYRGGTVVEIPTVDTSVPKCPAPYEPIRRIPKQPTPPSPTTTPTTITTTETTSPTTTPTTVSPPHSNSYQEWVWSTSGVNVFKDYQNASDIVDHLSYKENVNVYCYLNDPASPSSTDGLWYELQSPDNGDFAPANTFWNGSETAAVDPQVIECPDDQPISI